MKAVEDALAQLTKELLERFHELQKKAQEKFDASYHEEDDFHGRDKKPKSLAQFGDLTASDLGFGNFGDAIPGGEQYAAGGSSGGYDSYYGGDSYAMDDYYYDDHWDAGAMYEVDHWAM